VSKLDHILEPEPTAVRRLEIISGTGRRRRFSADDKSRIIEETLAAGAVVSEIARRHGLTPQQLFGWRRQARQSASAAAHRAAPRFVPAVVDRLTPSRPVRRRGRQRGRDPDLGGGVIEVEIDGVTIRIGRGAEPKTVAAVLQALKGSA
jgi:transposase